VLKKVLLVVLVCYLALWGLNKTAAETRQITAATPGSVLAFSLTYRDFTVAALGNGYRVTFPQEAQKVLIGLEQVGKKYYYFTKELFRQVPADVRKLLRQLLAEGSSGFDGTATGKKLGKAFPSAREMV